MKKFTCRKCGASFVQQERPDACPVCSPKAATQKTDSASPQKPSEPESPRPSDVNTPTIDHPSSSQQSSEIPLSDAVAKARQQLLERAANYPMDDRDPLATLGAGHRARQGQGNDSTQPTIELPSDALPDESAPDSTGSQANLEGTLINPNAAREAIENFSKKLDTVIPPRTISTSDQPGQLQDYKVQKRLGSGAFGVVFQALQVPLDRQVAVKVLKLDKETSESRKEKLKNEFLREAQFTGRLEHPNIVPIHDIGLTLTDDGQVDPFYVMKEIRGDSWLRSIRKKNRMANLEIFKKVANAIGYAHNKNILHCDLKPENVMLGEFGEVLVVDWGQSIDLSKPETIRPGGTPAYMAPEMAQYWIDIYLDKKRSSPSRKQIGFQTDVYLLAGLLFEIITEQPPHLADASSSPYDTIREAAANRIIDVAEFGNDELMQIALSALRVGDSHIKTVEELLRQIENYENRRLSIELRYRANELLQKAKVSGDYDDYQRARFGFEESLEKWPENKFAKTGLQDARLSCAQQALKDQNFDLGIGMLDHPENPEATEIKKQLVVGKRKRDRRAKLVRWLAAGLAASILIGLALNAYFFKTNLEYLAARDQAVEEREQAESAKRVAENQRQEILTEKAAIVEEKSRIEKQIEPLRTELAANQKEIEQFDETLKQEQQKFQTRLATQKQAGEAELEKVRIASEAEVQRERERQAEQLAENQRQFERRLATEQKNFDDRLALEQKQFEQQKVDLVKEKDQLDQQIDNLKTSSQLLRYKTQVAQVVEKLDVGDYRQARQQLDQFANDRAWEIRRLNRLAHREIEAIYPTERLSALAAAQQSDLVALLFQDRVEIRRLSEIQQVVFRIPIENASAIAVSRDGKKLAIAHPAVQTNETGAIWILDTTRPDRPRETKRLDAQSVDISDVKFSSSGNRLLSVGVPSKIRKSVGQEKELMVWDQSGSPIDVKLVQQNGSAVQVQFAEFSQNGRRILAHNRTGTSRDQVLHIFESRSERAFTHQAISRFDGVSAATFGDEAGETVLACVRDDANGKFNLIQWSPQRQTGFINTSTLAVQPAGVRRLREWNDRANFLSRLDNLIAIGGQNRTLSIWDSVNDTVSNFPGHSRQIDTGWLISSKPDGSPSILSGAFGSDAEILKVELETFQPEIRSKTMGRFVAADRPSPNCLSINRAKELTLGNDVGQAVIQQKNGTVQWNVAAWKGHYLSNRSLFALSRDDFLYHYDRETGALRNVITEIRPERGSITDFQVSDNGRIGLVLNEATPTSFQIWDLNRQTLIREIDFRQENIFGTGSGKILPKIQLSPDGKFVVGGKVGLYAWSVSTGESKRLTSSRSTSPRSSIGSISFVRGTSDVLGQWKDRLIVFDVAAGNRVSQFNTSKIYFDQNESSVFDAVRRDGALEVLARAATSQGGIGLFRVASNQVVASFPNAVDASFQGDSVDEIAYINQSNKGRRVAVWNRQSDQSTDFDAKSRLSAAFPKDVGRIQTVELDANGTLTLQCVSRPRASQRNNQWSTVSIGPDRRIGALRIIAQPAIDFAASTSRESITLENGNLRFWKRRSKSVQPDGRLDGFIAAAALNDDQTKLLIFDQTSGQANLIDVETRSSELEFRPKLADGESVVSISFVGNRQQVALGTDGGRLLIEELNLLTGKADMVRSYQLDTHPIKSLVGRQDSIVAFAPQSGVAYVVRLDASAESRLELKYFDGQKITTGDVTPDGKRVVTGSSQGRLTVWNIETNPKTAGTTDTSTGTDSLTERQILTLPNRHQSPVAFARFLNDLSLDLYSAESNDGQNRYLVWPTD